MSMLMPLSDTTDRSGERYVCSPPNRKGTRRAERVAGRQSFYSRKSFEKARKNGRKNLRLYAIACPCIRSCQSSRLSGSSLACPRTEWPLASFSVYLMPLTTSVQIVCSARPLVNDRPKLVNIGIGNCESIRQLAARSVDGDNPLLEHSNLDNDGQKKLYFTSIVKQCGTRCGTAI